MSKKCYGRVIKYFRFNFLCLKIRKTNRESSSQQFIQHYELHTWPDLLAGKKSEISVIIILNNLQAKWSKSCRYFTRKQSISSPTRRSSSFNWLCNESTVNLIFRLSNADNLSGVTREYDLHHIHWFYMLLNLFYTKTSLIAAQIYQILCDTVNFSCYNLGFIRNAHFMRLTSVVKSSQVHSYSMIWVFYCRKINFELKTTSEPKLVLAHKL